MQMTRAQFLNQIEDILEIESGTLKGDEILRDVEGWDSLATISVIAMADEQLGLTLTGNQIGRAVTVDDLVALADGKLSG
jgi:acyl carrier protein